ncbi:MAG: V-type ATP synthase subunit E [Thiobacillaceae bacterium]
MESQSQVSQLETALLNQARTLAREELHNAEISCNRIRADAAARLKLIEQREILAVKADAERLFRRRIQSEETHLSGELDQLRWTLCEAVLTKVHDALHDLVQDGDRYFPVLAGFLSEAARNLPAGALVAEVNATDLERLNPVWPDFVSKAKLDRKVRLAGHGLPSIGGLRIRSEDNRARVDQTFETRIRQLQADLARVAMEQLFSGKPDLDQLIHL